MYNLQFKDTKLILDIPSIKIDSKLVYNDIDGSTILVDESFYNFTLQIYKAIPSGKRKVNNYNVKRIKDAEEYPVYPEEGEPYYKDNINNYWIHIKRNGKH